MRFLTTFLVFLLLSIFIFPSSAISVRVNIRAFDDENNNNEEFPSSSSSRSLIEDNGELDTASQSGVFSTTKYSSAQKLRWANEPACGPFAKLPVKRITGNIPGESNKINLVQSPMEYLRGPINDYMIATGTACAFYKMRTSAQSAGIRLVISSAFRSFERQKFLKNCQITKKCNNGNLAATPGKSNHGVGLALDLNSAEMDSDEYRWLARNARKFGFVRTVKTEPWHWEYRPAASLVKRQFQQIAFNENPEDLIETDDDEENDDYNEKMKHSSNIGYASNIKADKLNPIQNI